MGSNTNHARQARFVAVFGSLRQFRFARARTRALRRTSLCALLLASACQETVLLGTECDRLDVVCEAPLPPPLVREDASTDDEPEPEVDASVGHISTLVIANPHFEGGIDGDVVLRQVVTNVTDLVLPPIPADLPNWFACWPLAVNSESTPIESSSNGANGQSMASGRYLAFTPNALRLGGSDFIAVRQKLEMPLRAGDRVHLAMDAVSRSGGAADLYIEIRGNTQECEGTGTLLGRSERLVDSTYWTSTCVTFEAQEDMSYLLIKPAAEGGSPESNAELLLDALRIVAECP